MPLAAGTRLGPYEIGAPIGKGGMGEVYRARDGKLGRDVAIKVLPEEFAQDTERLTRFEREAKLLASLNHPNIAGIYGLEESDGVKALVLELVDGPTLADQVAQGAIPIDEALPIANQVAEALEAGHEAGVVHRDLKPANIKLKEDGTVKVLDYGLAKALGGDAASATDSDLSQSPTLTRQGTQIGVILGTAPYMSPEQAKGKRVDKRTDIFAFGAVVYEMLTAKRAFAGDDVSDTLAAVIRAEPDFAALPVETPRAVVRILRLCLEKDPKERARDIGDVRLAMKGAFETEAKLPPSVSEPVGWRPSRALALASALAAVTAAVVWNLEPETPRPLVRASIVLPSEVLLDSAGRHMVTISPDGSRLAVTANDQIYLRPIDRTEVTSLGGTSGARNPFFSPDGEWLGFWSIQDGQLKKVAIRGGAAVSLCATTQAPWGARWGADGAIIFGQTPNIVRVSADGGRPEVVVAVDDGVAHSPQVLPGGRDILFTLGDGSNWDDARIVVHSLETGEREVLIERGRDARYVPSGHLVYVLDGTLMAVPFDADALEVTGGPVPMAENVMTTRATTGAAEFSVSDTGSLVYLTQGPEERRTLVWVDREGNEEVLVAEPRAYEVPRISPDGDRVAFSAVTEKETFGSGSLPGRR